MKKHDPDSDDAWVLGTIGFLVALTLLVGGFIWIIIDVTHW